MSQQHWPRISIHGAVQVYILDAKARRYSRATLDHYRYRLQPFTAFCQDNGIDLLADLTSDHIRHYLIHRQATGNSPYTLHTEARALRAWLNWCVQEGLIEESPMRNVAMPKRPREIRPAFSLDDVRRLLRHARHPRDKAIVLFLLDTGLRASEMVALNGIDVDITAGVVQVREGKGGKSRTVYIGAKTVKALLRYYAWRQIPAEQEPVWLSIRTQNRLTRFGLRQMLYRLGKAANIDQCSPHTFRRTFALWSLRSGMSIYVLQRLMGHEDIETLRQYLPLVEDDMEDAHRRFGPVDNLL